MSNTLTAAPDTASTTADLDRRVALIACGTREGKAQACDSDRRKGAVFVDIASTGAVDALAAAICGSSQRCQKCTGKAVEIICIYNEEAE
ncbi:hypothetical protein ABZ235_26680 [Streptomyces canus]|uniref:hypothetical protein n=1 Tax=Streptomyces canus TaxID=58343 RepID=UPI0033B154E9